MHSPDHSTKGTPSALGSATEQWPLAAWEDGVSGSVSSPSRGAFHLSLTVLVHYRSLKVLSLGGWSPQLPTRFRVSRGTQDADPAHPLTATGLSPAVVGLSNPFAFTDGLCCRSYNPILFEKRMVWADPASLATTTVSRHHSGGVAPFGISGLLACMQLPLNVSPVSASFIGLQRQGIHPVLD